MTSTGTNCYATTATTNASLLFLATESNYTGGAFNPSDFLSFVQVVGINLMD